MPARIQSVEIGWPGRGASSSSRDRSKARRRAAEPRRPPSAEGLCPAEVDRTHSRSLRAGRRSCRPPAEAAHGRWLDHGDPCARWPSTSIRCVTAIGDRRQAGQRLLSTRASPRSMIRSSAGQVAGLHGLDERTSCGGGRADSAGGWDASPGRACDSGRRTRTRRAGRRERCRFDPGQAGQAGWSISPDAPASGGFAANARMSRERRFPACPGRAVATTLMVPGDDRAELIIRPGGSR